MSSPRRRADPLAVLAGLCLVGVALGLIGRAPHLFDALSVVRLHLAALAALAAPALVLARRPAAAGMAGAAAALALVATPVAVAPAARAAAPAPDEAALTLVHANVYHANADIPALAAALVALGPDVLVTVETPAALLEAPALAPWAHRRVWLNPNGRGGPAIWSRRPLLSPDPAARAGGHPAMALARLPLPGGPPLQVGVLHLSWPVLGAQEWEYMDFNRFWRFFEAPTVLAGDFNAAPWSATLRRVAAISRTEPLGGVRGTLWGRLGLPIDHVLLSDGLGAEAPSTHALPGSDHRAVRVRLRIPRGAAGDAAQR